MSVTCEASQFEPAEKKLLEKLLGESIAPGEKVLIYKFPSADEDRSGNQEDARRRLIEMMEANRRHAVVNGITEEQANAAVDEAIGFLRGRES